MSIASVVEFVEKVRELYKVDPDPKVVWPAARPAMATMLADPELAASTKDWPVCKHQNLLFYEDPDYGFVLNGLNKAPAHKTRIHDHAATWVLYGVLAGGEEITHYDRTDDRSDPDIAIIHETDRTQVGNGILDIVEPYGIHAEEAGDEGSVAMIMRSIRTGIHLHGRYNLETGEYWQGKGVDQVPYPIIYGKD